MSGVEALARVLLMAALPPGRSTYAPVSTEVQAQTILADPGPLLEALAEAGVLREERDQRAVQIKAGPDHPRGRDAQWRNHRG